MHVGIDITPIIYHRGVSRYTANLTKALVEQKSGIRWTLYGNSLRRYQELRQHVISGSRAKLFRLPPKIINFCFNSLNLPIEVFTGDIDVFHAWDWYVPATNQARLVTTVHDLALFKFPQTSHRIIKKQHEQALKRALKLDAHFIAVSESTKNDLQNLFDISPNRITVIYEALPEESLKPYDGHAVTEVLQNLRISQPYLLCVGTIEPRKNYPNIIKAFAKFKDHYQLVIVGQKGWQAIQTTPGVSIIGEVNDHELNLLYANAEALVYPSLYEGFGLPILEAFHHQTPVITSNVSAMPEIAGDAAVLVNPADPEAIAAGISQALNNRQKYITRGQERLHHFSWSTTAKQTIKVYEHLGGSND